MAKIRTIEDINMRYVDEQGNTQVATIAKDSFIDVSESTAVYLCNEDVQQMSASEQKLNSRRKKAVRTGFFSMDNLTKPHADYTFL
jgi:hypothetical protein